MSRFESSMHREWLAVTLLTVLGAGLRFWGFGALGLNHFDEGIYALSGLWALSPSGLAGLDPIVIAYAPPGFPILVGLSNLVFGGSDIAAILASTLCGVATIPVAAWLGRRTFGVGGGAAAAALVALAMPHIAFSRKALTDVPFGLAWLIAIGLGGRFLEKPTFLRALALGLGVGFVQQFKYNGWLTGVIVALAAFAGLVCHSELRRSWLSLRSLLWGPVPLSLLAAGVALLSYWPWYRFVENHGGYSALVAHHRSYLGGVSRWVPYWKQQQAQLVALSGGAVWGAFTWSVAWLACVWSRGGSAGVGGQSRRYWFRVVGGLVGGGIALASLASLPWWVGLAAAPWLLVARKPGLRMLGSWWILLSILTPFYHPYARLWMPLHAAGWLLVAGLLVQLVGDAEGLREELNDGEATHWIRKRAGLVALALCGVAGLGLQWSLGARAFGLPRIYQATSTLRDVVAALPETIPESSHRAKEIVLLGRRPLAYYLLLQGRYPFRLVQGLDDALSQAGSWAILDDALFEAGIAPDLPPTAKDRVAMTRAEVLDPVTLLDVAPGAALRGNAIRSSAILLLKPAGSSSHPPVDQP